MNYEFPLITEIDDVLPHVEDCDDFVVADKGTYTVVNYNLQSSETFRPLTGDPQSDLTSIIRRECRGIIFDNLTKKIIRRPFHKFFNVGEREETIGLALSPLASVVCKLDGSMIAPFSTSDGVFRVGTKMGETDVAIPARDFILSRANYFGMCKDLIDRKLTPIFEWMSADNRIVIDYGEPQLVLTGVRNVINGSYWDRLQLEVVSGHWDIPLVDILHSTGQSLDKLIEQTRSLVGEEGYVIRFPNGHMAKVKSDWYVAIHKAKEKILYERYIISMILEQQVDDVIPYLLESDQEKLQKYTDKLIHEITQIVRDLGYKSFQLINDQNITRKEFALNHMKEFGPFSSIIFRQFDQIGNQHTLSSWIELFKSEVNALILQNCSTNSKLEQFKKSARLDLEW